MKKISLNILRIFAMIFTLFGLLGIAVFIPKITSDFGGFLFYIVWFVIGCVLYDKLNNAYKALNNSQNENENGKTIEANKELKAIHESPSLLEIISNNEAVVIQDQKDSIFPNTYIVLDIETPNKKNDAISQLGLVLIQYGKVIADYSTLINPECKFDPINTNITGINANMVKNAPTLNQYWNKINKLFETYVVVAHNANFDITVLDKALIRYGIDIPDIKYVCTLNEMKNKHPELPSHKLSSICDYYHIDVDQYHNARNDCLACSEILQHLLNENFVIDPQDIISIKYEEDITPVTSDEVHEEIKQDIPYSSPNEIDLTGKFVLTGLFTTAARNEIENYIKESGGSVISAVSGKTNYLIVGNEPDAAWKYGNYGTKINKAIELINSNKGIIHIIKEDYFIENTSFNYVK